MTSLFRYAFCVTSRSSERIDAVADAAYFDLDAEYELSPNIELLSGLHDCQLVLDRITSLPPNARLLDEREAGDLSLCVIAFSSDKPVSYRIDSDVEPLIRLFERPRSCREVMTLLSGALGVDNVDGRFFEDIARAGVIVPGLASRSNAGARVAARV